MCGAWPLASKTKRPRRTPPGYPPSNTVIFLDAAPKDNNHGGRRQRRCNIRRNGGRGRSVRARRSSRSRLPFQALLVLRWGSQGFGPPCLGNNAAVHCHLLRHGLYRGCRPRQRRRVNGPSNCIGMDGHNSIHNGNSRYLYPQTIPHLLLGRFLPRPRRHCGTTKFGAVCHLPLVRSWNYYFQSHLCQFGLQSVHHVHLLCSYIGTLSRIHPRCSRGRQGR